VPIHVPALLQDLAIIGGLEALRQFAESALRDMRKGRATTLPPHLVTWTARAHIRAAPPSNPLVTSGKRAREEDMVTVHKTRLYQSEREHLSNKVVRPWLEVVKDKLRVTTTLPEVDPPAADAPAAGPDPGPAAHAPAASPVRPAAGATAPATPSPASPQSRPPTR